MCVWVFCIYALFTGEAHRNQKATLNFVNGFNVLRTHSAIDFDLNHPVDLFSFLGQTESVLVIVIKIWIKLYTLYHSLVGWFIFRCMLLLLLLLQRLLLQLLFVEFFLYRSMAFAYALILQRARELRTLYNVFDIWNNRCVSVQKWKKPFHFGLNSRWEQRKKKNYDNKTEKWKENVQKKKNPRIVHLMTTKR